MNVRIIQGDCREVLKTLPDKSVHCIVTSPPYWGLRDYGVAGQIGLETTFDAFIAEMVSVFREVRRVLRGDGTLWLNLGDSYVSAPPGNKEPPKDADGAYKRRMSRQLGHGESAAAIYAKVNGSLPAKNLLGVPWRVAFALQADGWWLRQDIIWAKPNPMPESVTDRCTKAHEYIFLLSKSARYWFDSDAIREPHAETRPGRGQGEQESCRPHSHRNDGEARGLNRQPVFVPSIREYNPSGRNKRSVWEVATAPFSEAHFATFPPELIEPAIKAGCPKDGTVLDPFGGAGTTGLVADRLQRNAILIELNPQYAEMAKRRIHGDCPMFSQITEAAE